MNLQRKKVLYLISLNFVRGVVEIDGPQVGRLTNVVSICFGFLESYSIIKNSFITATDILNLSKKCCSPM